MCAHRTLLFLFTFPFVAGEFEMLKKLWMDEGGALLSVELILLVVITVIGITVGMVVLRDAVVSEYQSLAAAVNSIDTGYGWSYLEYAGTNSSAYVNGSVYLSSLEDIGTGLINNSVVGDGTLVNDPKIPAEILDSP
jgi:hypothetical protein